MDTERYEIFIHVKGTGFTFLLDKRMKHNFISPAFLAFFNLGEKRIYPSLNDKTGDVNTKPADDSIPPFLCEYSISTEDIFRYIGKKVGRCKDNKLRTCKVFMLDFEYDGSAFSFTFLLDKSLVEPAILGGKSIDKIKARFPKLISHISDKF